MPDNTPKPMTAAAGPEELLAAARRLSDTLPRDVKLPIDRAFELATHLSIAASLVAAIDRNTKALRNYSADLQTAIKIMTNPPVTVSEPEHGEDVTWVCENENHSWISYGERDFCLRCNAQRMRPPR